MRLNDLILIIIFITSSVFGLSYNLDYQQTASGEPSTTGFIQVNINNSGYGGILIYYHSNNWILAYPGCIPPGSGRTFSVPIQFSPGRQTVTISVVLFDYWDILQGDTCSKTSTDYTTAQSKKYSQESYSITVQTSSGCIYGVPVCDSNHECINNICELKKGCQYNNPPCNSDYYCQNNQCLLKPGCQYNNPPCSYGYVCEQNNCIAIITPEIEMAFKSKTSLIRSDFDSLSSKVGRLIELWTLLNDSEKVAYWTKVKNFAQSSYSNLSYTESLIVYPHKKSEVISLTVNHLTQIETARASLIGQNPKTVYIDTSNYTISAPITPNSTTTTITNTSGSTQTTTQDILDTSSVKSTIKKITNIDKLATGAKLDISIIDNNGAMRSFLLTKEASGWSAVESSGTGDISITILSYTAWTKLENSTDTCLELKRQMDRGNIGGITTLDAYTLFYKGYCNIKNCISQDYLPEIASCP